MNDSNVPEQPTPMPETPKPSATLPIYAPYGGDVHQFTSLTTKSEAEKIVNGIKFPSMNNQTQPVAVVEVPDFGSLTPPSETPTQATSEPTLPHSLDSDAHTGLVVDVQKDKQSVYAEYGINVIKTLNSDANQQTKLLEKSNIPVEWNGYQSPPSENAEATTLVATAPAVESAPIAPNVEATPNPTMPAVEPAPVIPSPPLASSYATGAIEPPPQAIPAEFAQAAPAAKPERSLLDKLLGRNK